MQMTESDNNDVLESLLQSEDEEDGPDEDRDEEAMIMR